MAEKIKAFLYYDMSIAGLPDIEDKPVAITDDKCEMKLTDDPDDTHGYKCGAVIEWDDDSTGKCPSCGADYLIDNKKAGYSSVLLMILTTITFLITAIIAVTQAK